MPAWLQPILGNIPGIPSWLMAGLYSLIVNTVLPAIQSALVASHAAVAMLIGEVIHFLQTGSLSAPLKSAIAHYSAHPDVVAKLAPPTPEAPSGA